MSAQAQDETVAADKAERRAFLYRDMTPGMAIIDIGCGNGAVVAELAGRGCNITGIEIDPALVKAGQDAGLSLLQGLAETLPVASASVDGIICSLVLPYTDERRAVAEWARVLKPGGIVNATYHGVGYGWNYLLSPKFGKRFYGLRMLLNTPFYGLTGKRLPGFLGDTLCQTSRRMKSHYKRAGLVLVQEVPMGKVMGQPQFLCHRVVKPA